MDRGGYILGISAFYHDSAAALVKDGEIIAAAQKERFTRVKHDPRFPDDAARYCLSEAGIEAADLELVAFYDKPLLKFERLLKTYLNYAPLGLRSFLVAMPLWLKQKLHIPDLIERQLGYRGRIAFCQHHQSHAASAFYPSPFEEAAIVTTDGVGEWATTTVGVGEGNRIRLLYEIRFPHSLGLLYSAFTYYLGFRVSSGEYKVMGLAPYGEPKYADLIKSELIDIKEDGSFKLNLKYFGYCAGLKMTNRRFHELFGGPPRKPETEITQRHMDIARSLQIVTEEVMLKIANHARRLTGKRYLCLAGGVALNCVANGRILREGPFEDIWIQPAAGDAGAALGAALFANYQIRGRSRDLNPSGGDRQRGSYLGPSFSRDEVKATLDECGAVYTELARDEVPLAIARLLAEGNTVGWFSGRMEFGPRALGARSILADPRNPEMQSILNLKVKFRESFRPFAPTVLVEHVSEYFELDRPSPYMLIVAPLKEDKRKPLTDEQKRLRGLDLLKVDRSVVPSITHVDYSARIQTIRREDHPLYYDTIKAFYDLTGVPIVINTSFNVRGEPIVCTPKDAWLCFMRTRLDYLFIEPFLLDKREQEPLDEEIDWQKIYPPD